MRDEQSYRLNVCSLILFKSWSEKTSLIHKQASTAIEDNKMLEMLDLQQKRKGDADYIALIYMLGCTFDLCVPKTSFCHGLTLDSFNLTWVH